MTRTGKLLTVAVVAWTFAATFLRALRPPNDFAEAHWLLDYRWGPVKRGLAGALLTLYATVFNVRHSEELIAAVSYLAFAGFALALAGVSLRLLARSQWSPAAILLVLVFSSSPFIVMSAHLVGYYDHIFITMTVLSIGLLLGGRLWLAALLQGAAILVHESTILVGFPLFCLAWLLVNGRLRPSGRRALSVVPLLLPIAVALTMFVVQKTLLAPGFEAAYRTHLAQFDFIRNNRSAMVPNYIALSFIWFYSTTLFIERLALNPSMHMLVLPSVLAFICFVIKTYDRPIWSFETAAFVTACLMPQLLHAVAWDTERIWTYSILTGFLAVWIYEEVGGSGRRVPPSVWLLCLIALVLNSVMLTPLMDQEQDRLRLGARLLVYLPAMAAACTLVAREQRARPPAETHVQNRLAPR